MLNAVYTGFLFYLAPTLFEMKISGTFFALIWCRGAPKTEREGGGGVYLAYWTQKMRKQ